MKPLETINEGAEHLLSESCRILGSDIDDVLVVGGWGTFLRNPNEHPGSRDVDILFPLSYDRERMCSSIMRFLDDGFLVSAKHDFQIMKPILIGDRQYLYNVDFLHPVVGKKDIVEFQDMIQFDETIDGFLPKKSKTVGIERGDLFFQEQMFESMSFNGHTFNGLNGTGIVLSKVSACMNRKRPRDIYDMTLEWKRNSELIDADLVRLINEYADFGAWLRKIAEFHAEKPDFFTDRVSQAAVDFGNPTESIDACQSMLRRMQEIAEGQYSPAEG